MNDFQIKNLILLAALNIKSAKDMLYTETLYSEQSNQLPPNILIERVKFRLANRLYIGAAEWRQYRQYIPSPGIHIYEDRSGSISDEAILEFFNELTKLKTQT